MNTRTKILNIYLIISIAVIVNACEEVTTQPLITVPVNNILFPDVIGDNWHWKLVELNNGTTVDVMSETIYNKIKSSEGKTIICAKVLRQNSNDNYDNYYYYECDTVKWVEYSLKNQVHNLLVFPLAIGKSWQINEVNSTYFNRDTATVINIDSVKIPIDGVYQKVEAYKIQYTYQYKNIETWYYSTKYGFIQSWFLDYYTKEYTELEILTNMHIK